MATVDLSYVQFWRPPLNPTPSKRASPHTRKNGRSGPTPSSQPASLYNRADEILGQDKEPKSAAAPAQHQGRDSAFQQEGDVAGAQGCYNDPANGNTEADDGSPSIDELLAFSSTGISTAYQNSADTPQHLEGPALNTSGSRLDPNPRPDDGVGNSQGTRDRPVALEDDESDTPEPVLEAAAVSVDAGADPASELSKGPWWDVEDECYVDDDLCPIPPLEQEVLASMPALAQPHSDHDLPGSSQDQVSKHDDGMGGALDEPAPPTLPQPLGEDSGGGSDESASELERDLQEQEKSSPAPAPSSPRPHRPSAEPPHPQTKQEHDRGGTSCGRLDELGRGPRRRSQDRGKEAREQQQRQEGAVELMREDGDGEEPGERGEKRRHPDETEGSDIHHTGASDWSHDAGDENDEDPRLAKRRKPPPTPTDNTLTPPDEPTTVANDNHHPSRTSRSPSVTVESATFAEYQEWPFHGFLKRTKIGNKTIYNLEFQLPHIPEHLHSEALGMRSNKEAASTGAVTPHDASTYSKVRPTTLQAKRKRVPWTPEEDAILRKMKEVDGCSWEEIHGAFPHRTPGTIQVHYSTSRAGVGKADVSGGQQQKRQRGRPRKQA